MFTSGGHNIYPKQIENILIEHPSVKDAAVIGIEDDVKGHKPYAFVISDAKEDVLKEHVLKFFPPSHCPRNIWNVEEMPLNRNLKVDKKMLIQRAYYLINNRS
jgi:acyl-coenzyme A synthetase/AMP-(fatty) acid ligase